MSSAPDSALLLVLDILAGRTSEGEFPARAGLEKKAVPDYAPEIVPVLNALVKENRHTRHEDIVFALGKLKDPSSVPYLLSAAETKHPYLQDDEAFALGTESIYALRNIGTPEALEARTQLSHSSNAILRATALGGSRAWPKSNPDEYPPFNLNLPK